MSEASTPRVRAARLIGAFAFYVTIGMLGRQACALPDGGGPLVCLAAAAGVALVALGGGTMVLAVAAGATAVALLAGVRDPVAIVVLATCNGLGALAGGTLLARARMDRIADVSALLGAAASMVVLRWIGVTCFGQFIPPAAPGALWRPGMSAGLGVLVGTPAILAWARHRVVWPSAARMFETAVLFLYICAISTLVFASPSLDRVHAAGLVLLPLPLMVWAAMRFDPRMASTGLLAMVLVAAHGAVCGLGPFAGSALGLDAMLPGTFFAIVAISIHALVATASERHDKAFALWRTNRVLREIGRFAQNRHDFAEAPIDEHALMAAIGRAAGVSRVYVLKLAAGPDGAVRAQWRGGWVAPDAPSWPDEAAQAELPVAPEGFASWLAAIERGEAVEVHATERLAPARAALARIGARSTVCTSIPVDGRAWGVIGFDACDSHHPWSSAEVEGLRIAAGVFGCAMGRARAVSALARSERRYRALTERSADLVAIIGADSCVKYMSPQIEALLGIRAEDFVGRDAFGFVDPRDQDVIRRSFEAARAHPGQPVPVGASRVRHADPQRVIYCEGTVADLLDDTEIGGLVCNFREVTARVEAEARARALEAEVRHARQLEQMSVIAGGLAHDFNNHLSRVLGHAELALQRLSSIDPAADPVRKIAGAARDAEKFGRQLVACSGRGPVAVEPVDLGRAVLPEAAGLVRSEVGPLVEFVTMCAASLPAVLGDATQLRQMVEHLVRHAAESLDGGQGRIDLTAALHELGSVDLDRLGLATVLAPGRYVALVISDSGKGIDTPARDRFFEPVFAPDFSGQGLAMAACLGIVRGHRGAIQVESRLGVGTVRTVLLPATDRVPAVGTPLPQARAPVATGSATTRATVLMVDDDALIRDLGREILELAGFDVELASDGVEALEVHARLEGRVACVVLDLTMPRLSGERTLVRLRERDRHLPILLASGYTDADLDVRFAQDPRLAFVAKPFTIDELQQAVHELLRNGAPVSPAVATA